MNTRNVSLGIFAFLFLFLAPLAALAAGTATAGQACTAFLSPGYCSTESSCPPAKNIGSGGCVSGLICCQNDCTNVAASASCITSSGKRGLCDAAKTCSALCSANSDCTSNYCGYDAFGSRVCQTAPLGPIGDSACLNQPVGNSCPVGDGTYGRCTTDGRCASTAHGSSCVAGNACTTSTGAAGTCNSSNVCIANSGSACPATPCQGSDICQNGVCVSAGNRCPATPCTGTDVCNVTTGVCVPGGGGNSNGPTVGLVDPFGGMTLQSFLTSILDFVIQIGTVVIIFMIVYIGYLFVVAQGNETKLTEARRALLWTVVGALILLGSKAIALGLQETVNAIQQGH